MLKRCITVVSGIVVPDFLLAPLPARPDDVPRGVEREPVAAVGADVVERLVTWRAISGLRITSPSSLLKRAERASMLSEPMNTVR